MSFWRYIESERNCWTSSVGASIIGHAVLLFALGIPGWLTLPERPPAEFDAPIEVEVVALSPDDAFRLLQERAPATAPSMADPKLKLFERPLVGPKPFDVSSLAPPDRVRTAIPQPSLPSAPTKLMEFGDMFDSAPTPLRTIESQRRPISPTDLLTDALAGAEGDEAVAVGERSNELVESPLLDLVTAKKIMKYREEPRYDPRWARFGLRGVGVYEIRVDSEGLVASADVIESSGSGQLDTAALDALRNWRFDPRAMERLGTGFRFKQRFAFNPPN